MENDKERLAFRIPELCAALGISRATYAKWKKEGVMVMPRETRVGGVVLVEAAEAKAWLERQRIQ